jgi:hypothetical protein
MSRRPTVAVLALALALGLLGAPAAAQFANSEVSGPGSPTPFRVTKTTWSWEDLGGVTYSVYRSDAPSTGFACILDLHPATSWTGDPASVPASRVWHYLVTAYDGTDDNSPGDWSDGTARTLDTPCPRDGACCLPDGTCTDVTSAACAALGGAPQGAGTACGTTACPQTEACCRSDGTCDDLPPADCLLAGGTAQGAGSTCATISCPQREACCFSDGTCSDLFPVDCAAAGGTAQGAGTACASTVCPQPQACCLGDGTCADLFPVDCATAGGIARGPGSTCATTSCPQPEACCSGDGTCDDLFPVDCATAGGIARGPGSTCATTSCPQPEACCVSPGTCRDLLAADCLAALGTPLGAGTRCVTSACPQLEACCMPDGSCSDSLAADCAAAGGIAEGPGTTCATTACPQPQACCLGDGNCAELLPLDCGTAGGIAQGAGTTCATTSCPQREACCLGDGSCTFVLVAECATVGGVAQGVGSTCATVSCPQPEACCMPVGSCTDSLPADCATAGGTAQGAGTTCAMTPCQPPCRAGTPVPGMVPLRLVSIGPNFAAPMFLTTPTGDPRLFILERAGRIRIQHADGSRVLFHDFSSRVLTGGERGALGLAFHPDYATNGLFYVHYSTSPSVACSGDNCARIVEFRRSAGDPDLADALYERILITQADPFSNHNGGWLAFGPDGYLYAAFGDGGSGGDPLEAGQDLAQLFGKILRVDVDGRDAGLEYAVPPDNPFVGMAGARAEIWSYGVRNPWRNAFDRANGDLYIADVGQNRFEEVDVATVALGAGRGVNYGWDDMEASACFEPMAGCLTAGRVLPDHEYPHSDGCSITGGYVYRGCLMPDWNGWYFFAEYCNEWMDAFNYSMGVAATLQRVFPPATLNSPVSFGEDAEGELYVIEQGGGIFRLEPQ